MCEEKNEELIFKEKLDETVESFGKGSQEGAKVSIRNCQVFLGVCRLVTKNKSHKLLKLTRNTSRRL